MGKLRANADLIAVVEGNGERALGTAKEPGTVVYEVCINFG